MSRFSYSGDIDRKNVIRAQIQGRLTDLSTFINAPSIEEPNFKQRAVRYRHILQPPTIELADEFFGVPTLQGPYSGWYAITDSILKFDLQHTSLPNIHEEAAPVIQIKAKCHAYYLQGFAGVKYDRCCIGYSTDDGVTWTPLASQSRPFEAKDDFQFFDGPWGVQNDYMTGAAGYIPTNMNFRRRTICMASAGGDTKDVPSSGARWFCVMLNSNVINADTYDHSYPAFVIEGSARWTEKTP